MPAVSKLQQAAMGMAYSARKGRMFAGNLRGSAKSIYESDMSTEAIRDFAKTKARKLPHSIKEAVVGKIMLGLGKRVVKSPLKAGMDALYISGLKSPFNKSLKAITKSPLKKL